MEKAKLTKAQAKVIQRNLGRVEEEQPQEREYMVRRHIEMGKSQSRWAGENEALNVLSIDTLCRALYVGYEIIEEYQVVTMTEEMREDIKSAIQKSTREEDHIWNQGAEYVLKKLRIKL